MNNKGAWQAMKELRPHVHRIRSLSISVAFLPQATSLLGLILEDQAPASLTHLYLMAKPGGDRGTELQLGSESNKQNFVQLCNQLQTLELNNVWIDLKHCSFGRLAKLTLSVNSGFFDTLKYLPSAHGLRFLEVRDTAAWRVQERADPESNRDVKVLRLRRPHPFCSWEMQGHPALKSQRWDVIDFHLPNNLTVGSESKIKSNLIYLVPYMSIHSSRITMLTLRNGRPEILKQMRSMLQVLPNLHTLTFDMLGLPESTLSLFIPPESSETFPKFRTLRVLLSDILHLDTFKALISSHPIQRLDLWHSRLDWDDGTENRSYRPTGHSPFYEWLCEQVPELYMSK